MGPAHPNYKHGRYSKVLAKVDAERYQEALDDPNLLQLRHDIALLDTMIGQTIIRAQRGDVDDVWRLLGDLQTQVDRAVVTQDRAALMTARDAMRDLIRSQVTADRADRKVVHLLDARRKTVDTERRLMVDLQQMITTEQAIVLLDRVLDVITKHVHDRDALTRIAYDVRAITAGAAG
jgi:hypothetical protein